MMLTGQGLVALNREIIRGLIWRKRGGMGLSGGIVSQWFQRSGGRAGGALQCVMWDVPAYGLGLLWGGVGVFGYRR